MIGSTVSHYEILSELGRGGMGVVYKARDTRLGRTVALKFLPRDMTRDREARARFEHEAQAASALDHNHICTVYEIGETDDGHLFIAMAYYEGDSLEDLVEEGPLPLERALKIGTQLADGLAKAHESGIIHRDVKPANVMITSEGDVKIVDFGLAKVAEQTQLTQQGSTVGTTAYMSPEQARGDEVDPQTDQWSLGVVLYEMLTGRRAFRGAYPQAVIFSILNEDPEPVSGINPDIPPDLAELVERTLAKDPDERFDSVRDLYTSLEQMLLRERGVEIGVIKTRRRRRLPRLPKYALPAAAAAILVVVAAIWLIDRQADIRYARETLMPRIDSLRQGAWSDAIDVVRLAQEAEQHIPNEPRLAEVFESSTLNIDVATEPPGAEVYVKPYARAEEEWEFLGVSPLEDVRLPIGIFRWKLQMAGYDTVYAAAASWAVNIAGDTLIVPQNFFRTLDEAGTLPEGMVRVPGMPLPNGSVIGDFFIDRFEVSNRQFKAFVDAGGYRDRSLWRHEMVRDGAVLEWEDAMAGFVDVTGRPGPATWQAGFYPEGEADHPVTGVSWYEAAAYAAWKGADLPTEAHWGRARGDGTPFIQVPQLGGFGALSAYTNFAGVGAVAVGSLDGYTSFGAHDMAGNVREWCWNETPNGRLIRGASWDDVPYEWILNVHQAPAMDRSAHNGFRLAIYPERDTLPEALFGPTVLPPPPDLSDVEPASDTEFELLRAQFEYDDFSLAAVTDRVDDSSADWTHEQVSFRAPYGDERISAHLFLPKNVAPPYQTVIYFPGSAAEFQMTSANLASYYEFTAFLSFLVRNGRAVMFPVYQGMFERNDPEKVGRLYRQLDLVAYTEMNVQRIKDARRSIDYLESRDDIDSDRIAYYGMSVGGLMGPIVTAVEDRFATSVLLAAGIGGRLRSTIWNYHYAPRVTVPTLILGGEYDTIFPSELSAKPLYEMLGTAEEDKELRLYPTDHIPPMNDVIREILAWLDKTMGPVGARQPQ